MKQQHSLTSQRDAYLRNLHTHVIRNSGINPLYLSRDTILDTICSSPAPRFYINAKQAQHYVTSYYRGVKLHRSAHKMAMIKDLVAVFEEIRPENMHLPMREIWQMVVEHPAKSFYLTRQRVKETIFNYRIKK